MGISKNTNESEAMSAARTARKLMLKYHISMAEGEKTGGGSCGRQAIDQRSIPLGE